MGINEHHKIISTEGFDSQSLGIRTLIHFFFIDEEHIFGKRTVLDSPSYSKINAYLCALNFLLTGDDSMHLMPEETKEEMCIRDSPGSAHGIPADWLMMVPGR